MYIYNITLLVLPGRAELVTTSKHLDSFHPHIKGITVERFLGPHAFKYTLDTGISPGEGGFSSISGEGDRLD